jgi:hypothetical protein
MSGFYDGETAVDSEVEWYEDTARRDEAVVP